MKTMKNLVLKPLAAAALLCTGAVYAAPPLTSTLNGSLAGLRGSTNGLNSIVPSNTNSSLLDLRLTLGSTTNSLTGGGVSSLPGLRKDATADLVQTLQLRERSGTVLDALPMGGASRMKLPLAAAAPAIKRPIQEVEEAADDANDNGDDNGFLGVNNSSTLGTDDGSDNDGGFLGAGDSTTLGTDNDRDPGDSGFLGAANSSTLGTDSD